ncbi:unnamed protein product [Menidia menidia]|uniref:(Atlantic silverside) hypothetical protein n=1 Tax=Menidia menidia TaxID=238744 RepID=A0A8S4ADH1_9TELE|nr:unnamed protein product [Menidia menidia]
MYRCANDSVLPVQYDCSSTPAPACRRAGEALVSMADDASCCPRRVCGEPPAPGRCALSEAEGRVSEGLCGECDPRLCQSDVPSCREDQTLSS